MEKTLYIFDYVFILNFRDNGKVGNFEIMCCRKSSIFRYNGTSVKQYFPRLAMEIRQCAFASTFKIVLLNIDFISKLL